MSTRFNGLTSSVYQRSMALSRYHLAFSRCAN
nr:MAG TPA: hypothetical protein [Caudoviricetes sp.]